MPQPVMAPVRAPKVDRVSESGFLFQSLIGQIALIVVLHRILLAATMRIAVLPADSYLRPSLAWAALTNTPFTILLAAAVLPLILRRRHIGWSDIDTRNYTRAFILVPVAILAWICSLYAPNLALGQMHLDARLLIVALAAACWYNPIFVAPFVLFATVVIGQIQSPLPWGEWHWADKRLPYDTLILFTAYLHVRAWSKPQPQLFAFLVLALTGATYGYPAFCKITLGPTPFYWLFNNDFGNLFIGAHINGGWLRNLPEGTVVRMAGTIARISPILCALTVLAESSAIALLWHRRFTAPILSAIIAMHVAILLTTGIFFWKWIIQNAALLAYIHFLNRADQQDRRTTHHRALSLIPARIAIPAAVVLVLLAKPMFSTLRYAWFDSRFTNYFEIRATGQSGRTYRLDPRFFAPYDLVMQQSRFYYVLQRPVIAQTYATVYDWTLAESLENGTLDSVPAIKGRLGQVFLDDRATQQFVDFLRRTMRNANARKSRNHHLAWLAAPFHFRTTMASDTYEFEEPITGITLRWQEWFYDGVRLHHLTDEPVLAIDVGS